MLATEHIATASVSAVHLDLDGSRHRSVLIAEETPVAFRYNDFPHSVMMATPADIEDFVLGFSLTEGIIVAATEVTRLDVCENSDGIEIEVTLAPDALHRYLASRRVRQSRGRTSCGLCGVEDLKDVRRTSRLVPKGQPLDAAIVRAAAEALRAVQPLSSTTRAAHASAWVSTAGTIAAVREDIGRHNSLDKLIGAGLRGAFHADGGFCLITSRCSYEMAEKAIIAGFTTLVSISAPTALAVRAASAAGLTLYSLACGAGQFLYAGPLHTEEVARGTPT